MNILASVIPQEVFLDEFSSFLDRYGFPLLLLLAVGYSLYKWVIPIVAEQFKRQQDFLFREIERLNQEARERNDKMLNAFQLNTQAFNDLKQTQEAIRGELKEMRSDLQQVQEDVHEVFKIVGERKNLIRKDTP